MESVAKPYPAVEVWMRPAWGPAVCGLLGHHWGQFLQAQRARCLPAGVSVRLGSHSAPRGLESAPFFCFFSSMGLVAGVWIDCSCDCCPGWPCVPPEGDPALHLFPRHLTSPSWPLVPQSSSYCHMLQLSHEPHSGSASSLCCMLAFVTWFFIVVLFTCSGFFFWLRI